MGTYYGLVMPQVYTGGVYIKSIKQTKESDESGGTNEITATLTNRKTEVFKIKNGVSAGFGEPTATADTLDPGSEATVEVKATGGNTAKEFSFKFGIPKGEPFAVYRTFTDTAAMNADTSVPEGKFVVIASGVEDEDNAKLFVRTADGYSFVTDLSGAQGIKGDKGDTGAQGPKGDKGEKGDYSSELTETTWAALKAMRDAGELIAGAQYRITDYVTTSVQAESQSAGHVFDVIVTADGKNVLNENARAAVHDGDTYFVKSKLQAWKLKYCLDNDTNRFAWADGTNGKGVIWHMEDEFGNICAYDFKNIQFKRYKVTARTNSRKPEDLVGGYYGARSVQTLGSGSLYPSGYTISTADIAWRYTFDYNGADYSLNTYGSAVGGEYLKYCYGNKVAPYMYQRKMGLGNNVFLNTSATSTCKNNSLTGESIYSNTFGNNCYYNTFGNNCYSNTFGNSCYSNTFGNSCYSNTFGYSCYSNTFGNSCSYNTFGNSCSYNTFGNYCSYNTFGNNCYYNTFGNNCSYNTFGNYCYSNTFGNSCYSNTFGNNCSSNTFGNNCSSNTFGNTQCYWDEDYYSENQFIRDIVGNYSGAYLIPDKTLAYKAQVSIVEEWLQEGNEDDYDYTMNWALTNDSQQPVSITYRAQVRQDGDSEAGFTVAPTTRTLAAGETVYIGSSWSTGQDETTDYRGAIAVDFTDSLGNAQHLRSITSY